MRNVAILIFLALLAEPAHAQLVRPELAPPPCSDPHNCPNYKRGAALPAPGPSQVQHTACPAGTVFNPKRGTCKVLSSH